MKQASVVRPRNQPPPRRRDAEVEPGPEDVDAARVGLEERDRRLREHERDVALEPVPQPLALVRDRIARRAQVDEHVVAVELDREAAQLVGELVERAAGRQVEARVVPVAREDAVADGAAMEREAHVRTAVVDRVHLVAVGEQADDVPVEVDDEPARPPRSSASDARGRRRSAATSVMTRSCHVT